MQVTEEDSESSKGEEEQEGSSSDKEETEDEEDKRRRSALEKLGNASEDSILGQVSLILYHQCFFLFWVEANLCLYILFSKMLINLVV